MSTLMDFFSLQIPMNERRSSSGAETGQGLITLMMIQIT
jgi:hypothetical protein